MASTITTYTTCVKITRTDAVVLGITELDQDLNVSGVDYISAAGYTPTDLDNTSDLSVNNADLEGLLTSVGVEREDIVAGLYDYAAIEFFLYDFVNLVVIKQLGSGTWGESTLTDGKYVAEFRSLTQALQQTIGEVYTAECSATLGDAKCGITLATFTASGEVTAITSNSIFSDTTTLPAQADAYYAYGNVTWTSGLNIGLKKEVKASASGLITLVLPMPYAIVVGDTFDISAGCDKSKAACIAKFNNVINFRGFDFIPGQDEVTKFGGQ